MLARRLARRGGMAALAAAILVALVPLTSGVALAEDEPVTDGGNGSVVIVIQVPGTQGDGSGGYGSDEGVNLNPCYWVVAEDPGAAAAGFTSSSQEGYPTSEQIESPGVVWYSRRCPEHYGYQWVLVGEPPPPGLPPPPTPGSLAALAVKYMQIPLPDVEANPASPGVVNLPTWLWLANDSWTVPPGRLSLRGVTVTVIVTPKYVDWNTGAGTRRCNGQGREYDTSAPPEGQSTYCSWTYTESSAGQPGEKFQGTATSVWGVHWISSGGPTGPQQGDLPDISRTSAFEYMVEEIQSVVTK